MSLEAIVLGTTFLLGAVIASFIGLVVARLSTGTSIVVGRSVCDACGAILSPLSLVPILSWLVAGGRCALCQARVSADSPISEALLGVLFALAYLKLGATLPLLFVFVALALLLALVLYDFAHSILPPVLLTPFVLCGFVIATLTSPDLDTFTVTCLAALLMGSLLALIHLGSGGRAMGFADAPLATGLALLAGPSALAGFVLSFWIGGAIGIILLVTGAYGTKIGKEVPFAPFLAAGFLLAYFASWDVYTLTDFLAPLLGA